MITIHVNITKMKIKFVLSVYNKLYSLGKLFMIHFCVNLVYLFFLYHGFLVYAFKLGGGVFLLCYIDINILRLVHCSEKFVTE